MNPDITPTPTPPTISPMSDGIVVPQPSVLENSTTSPVAPVTPAPSQPYPGYQSKKRRTWMMVYGLLTCLLIIILVAIFSQLRKPPTGDTAQGDTYTLVSLSLDGSGIDLNSLLGQISRLDINGHLQVNGSVVITPGDAPTSPSIGQIYVDNQTNQLYFYDGDEYQMIVTTGNSGDVIDVPNINLSGYLTAETDPIWSAASNNYFNLNQNETVTGNPSFTSGLTTTSLTVNNLFTAGIVTNTAAGVLGTVATVPLANGGTNANLTASNGGIVWTNATQMQVLAGTGTAGLCLLSGSNATPTWGACAGGASMFNPMSTLGDLIYGGLAGTPTRLGGNTTTDTYVLTSIGDGINTNIPSWSALSLGGLGGVPTSRTLSINGTSYDLSANRSWSVGDMLLGTAQSVTALKTFDNSMLAMKGTSTGVTTIATANTSANNYTLTLPAATGVVALTSDLHSAVTLGTANGLGLSTQQLSLALASAATTGALSDTDWNIFNNKQPAGSYLTAEADDLADVTGRGANTSTASAFNGGLTASSLTVNNLSTAGIVTNTAAGVIGTVATVDVVNGGTGAATFAQYGVLYGNTTSAIQATAAGATGQCLIGTTGAAPSWGACGVGGSGMNSLTLAGSSGTPQSITDTDTITIAQGTNITTVAGATDTVTISTVDNPTFATSTTTPTVYGSTAANGTLTLQGNSAVAGNTATNANLVFKVGDAGATTAMTIRNNGYVGVGTAAPATQLEVSGTGANVGSTVNAPLGYSATQYFAENGANKWHNESAPGGASFSIVESSIATQRMTVLVTSGNVGISNSSPDQKLEVMSATAANTQITVSNTNAGSYDSQFGFELADGTNAFTIGVDDSDTDKFKISTTALGTNDRLVVISTGSIGIGDTSPLALLTVGSGDLFRVNTSGQIATAAGITSSGTITLSGLSTSGVVTNTAAGVLGTVAAVGVANGGTGETTLTQYGVLYGRGINAVGATSAGITGQCFIAVTGAAPAWGSCAGAGAGMTVLTLAGSSGTPQSITDTDTITIAQGTNITTVAGATDTVTISTVANPVFATSTTTPTVYGSTAANGTLVLQGTTSGGNTLTNANLQFKVGDAGATTAMTILNNGYVGVGIAAPTARLQVAAATTSEASLNVTASAGGVNPAAPNSGDLWWNGTNLYFYNGTINTDLLAGITENNIDLQLYTPGTQQVGHMNISGTGILGTSLLTPLLDANTAAALNIGTTNATQINLNQDTFVNGNATVESDANSAFVVQNSSNVGLLNADTTNMQVTVTNEDSFDSYMSSVVVWGDRVYDGFKSERGHSVVQTADGGYAVTGYTEYFAAGYPDSNNALIAKYDSNLNLQWDRTWGGTRSDIGYSIIQTSDGGYVITGESGSFEVTTCSSYSPGNCEDMFIAKYDGSGNLLWDAIWAGDGDQHQERGFSVFETVDGDYMVGGQTNSFYAGTSYSNYFLANYDSSGNLLWTKTYGDSDLSFGYKTKMAQTSDGGYLITGSGDGSGGGWAMFFMKIDASGNLLLSRQWDSGGYTYEYGSSIIETADGGYAITGTTDVNDDVYGADDDMFIAKFDSSGNLMWDRTLSSPYNDIDESNAIVQTADGGYVIAGTMLNSTSDYELSLAKFDSSGNFLWVENFVTTGLPYDWGIGWDMVKITSGGFMVVGDSQPIDLNINMILAKFDFQGNIVGCGAHCYTPSVTIRDPSMSAYSPAYITTSQTAIVANPAATTSDPSAYSVSIAGGYQIDALRVKGVLEVASGLPPVGGGGMMMAGFEMATLDDPGLPLLTVGETTTTVGNDLVVNGTATMNDYLVVNGPATIYGYLSATAGPSTQGSIFIDNTNAQMQFGPAGTGNHSFQLWKGGTLFNITGEDLASPMMEFDSGSPTPHYYMDHVPSGSSGYYMCWETTNYEITRGASCSLSSIKYKENVQNLDSALSAIDQLRPVSFDWKASSNTLAADGGIHDYGLIAEEVNELFPEIVGWKNGEINNIKYEGLIPIVIKGIQEQQAEIAVNTSQIDDLNTEISLVSEGLATVQSLLSASGDVELNHLQVNTVNVASLTVTDQAIFEGSVVVKDNLSVGNITVNGHIISAGDTPTVTPGIAAGEGAITEVMGNDTGGTITVTTGEGTTTNDLVELVFSKPFSRQPRVVLTPSNIETSDLLYYADGTVDKFLIRLIEQSPLEQVTYEFNYFIIE